MAENSTRIQLKISGDGDVKKMLHNLGLTVTDLRPAMQDTGKYLTKFFAGEVFASRGQIIGEPWQRLSEPYASRKAKLYRKGVLVATGAMQKSFHYATTNTSVTITNDDPKFRYHQSDEPRSKIPRRVMMKLVDNDARYEMIVAIIARRLSDTIAKNGGA
ncbi:phage virion morphogenesis protein [Rhodococcus sp. IEGM 1374]|uniref:phage virion morphogenesis protein n=1 Tax=Rhodococcus sp. IEGM 1374 TaxID=3082221 RepID=UPI0029540DC7|nr:phage virion morphogenesis protein [Rhodococcus sp. IEGM 1374]MDV7992061.1 phage virion morphogenesis protein [Rhodococcus sp. IEGM 1374]